MGNENQEYAVDLRTLENIRFRIKGFEANQAGDRRDSFDFGDYKTNANLRRCWIIGWDGAENKRCKGQNCRAIEGVDHSDECKDEHERMTPSSTQEGE